MQDVGDEGLLVMSAEECEAACAAVATCNMASYYLVVIADTGLNCYLKTLGDACMLPPDAIDDPNAIMSLQCDDALASGAMEPLSAAGVAMPACLCICLFSAIFAAKFPLFFGIGHVTSSVCLNSIRS